MAPTFISLILLSTNWIINGAAAPTYAVPLSPSATTTLPSNDTAEISYIHSKPVDIVDIISQPVTVGKYLDAIWHEKSGTPDGNAGWVKRSDAGRPPPEGQASSFLEKMQRFQQTCEPAPGSGLSKGRFLLAMNPLTLAQCESDLHEISTELLTGSSPHGAKGNSELLGSSASKSGAGVESSEGLVATENLASTLGQSYREYHPLPSSDPLKKMYGPTGYILREIRRHGFLSPKLTTELLEIGWQVDKEAVDLAMRHGIVFNDFTAAKGIISAIASSSPLLYGDNPDFMELRDLARMPEVMKAIGFDEGFSLMNQAVKSIAAKSVGTTTEALEEVAAGADSPQDPTPDTKGDKKAEKKKAKDVKKKAKEAKKKAKGKQKGEKPPHKDLRGIEYLLPERTQKEWIRDQLTKWINFEKKGKKKEAGETEKEIDLKKTAKIVGDEGFKLYGGVGALVKSSLVAAQVVGMVGPTAAKAAIAPEILEGSAALIAEIAAKAAARELAKETTKATAALAVSITFGAIGGTIYAVSALGLTAGGILWGILSHRKKQETKVYYKHMKEAGIEGKMMPVQVETLRKEDSIMTTITQMVWRMQITVTRTETKSPLTETVGRPSTASGTTAPGTTAPGTTAPGTTAARTLTGVKIVPANIKTSKGHQPTGTHSPAKSSGFKPSETRRPAPTIRLTSSGALRTGGAATQTGSGCSSQNGGTGSILPSKPKGSFDKTYTRKSSSGKTTFLTVPTYYSASPMTSYLSTTVKSIPTSSSKTGLADHESAMTTAHPLSTPKPKNLPIPIPIPFPAPGLNLIPPGRNQTTNSTAVPISQVETPQLDQKGGRLNGTTSESLNKTDSASVGNEPTKLHQVVPSWNQTRLRRYSPALGPQVLPAM